MIVIFVELFSDYKIHARCILSHVLVGSYGRVVWVCKFDVSCSVENKVEILFCVSLSFFNCLFCSYFQGFPWNWLVHFFCFPFPFMLGGFCFGLCGWVTVCIAVCNVVFALFLLFSLLKMVLFDGVLAPKL